MNGYKYVGFSKATAKSNPQMIINEYDRIVDSLREKTRGISSTEYEIGISPVELMRQNYLWQSSLMTDDLKFKVNYKELKMIMDKIEVIKADQIKMLKTMELVEIELFKFKRNFK